MNKSFSAIRLVIIFLSILFTHEIQAQEKLRMDILNLVHGVNGNVGVGIKHLESGDTLTIHGSDHFPMQSVYKFHLALAVLANVDQEKLSVDQKVFIRKEDLLPHTHSPIADKYPNGNVALSIKELLSYTVSQSDNNGCDILFRLVGGPKKVEAYIHSLGVNEVAIVNTEKEMHTSWDLQFKNWTSPAAMVELLDLFYRKKILSPSSRHVLMEIMEQTITGSRRIKGLLPKGTIVAHKTGMGGNDEGVIAAINDVGIITLPTGKHVAIAFFISNTREPIDPLEDVMAKISKIVFDYYSKQ